MADAPLHNGDRDNSLNQSGTGGGNAVGFGCQIAKTFPAQS
jgi:hypothetical protein